MLSGLIQLLNNFGLAQEFILKATFYSLAGLTCLFALFVVISRNVFHSAIFLALTLIGVAGVYLYLDAEFLAAIQVLIYVGAIITLFIFAIMLTSKIQDLAIRQTNQQVIISGFAALTLLFLFINIINRNPWRNAPSPLPSPQWVEGQLPLSLAQLGKSLMTTYALPFEVISLILLAALVGAIVIGKVKKE